MSQPQPSPRSGPTRFSWLVAILLVAFGPAPGALASWAPNGNPASLAAMNQVSAQGISDGLGGIILVWEDYRNGNADVYAQHLDMSGAPLWGADGLAVCTDSTDQQSPVLTSDGAGGAIIAWQDLRDLNYDIYAQRVSAGGTVQWTSNGVPVCTAAGSQVLEVATSDGANGAIIGWRDLRSGDSDVYAQRLSATGTRLWTPADGVGVCVLAGSQTDVRILGDPRGGAFLVWRDRRAGLYYDIYAQSLDSGGAPRWTANGMPVCAATYDQLSPSIALDGRFGLLVAWQDQRNGIDFNVWAQRLKPDGSPRWTLDGVQMTNAAGQQSTPVLIPDGSAGAIVAWTDSRVARPDIYAQRADSAGALLWAPGDGVAVCASDSSQFLRTGVSDEQGGAIFAWDDDRSGGDQIYAQSVAPNGTRRWATPGLLIATASGSRTLTTAVADGYHGALFGWQDFRNGPTADVYAFRVTSLGTSVEPSRAPAVPARLYPARPNPFNPSTAIEFSLDAPSRVSLAVHDIQGRRVRVLADGSFDAGRHTVRWDGADQAGRPCGSGVYFVRLALPQGTRAMAITLVR
ncbi:MAG TPA: FlgD immunoglobulin-like domain containing protein [Candidatus Eisenbacteria bacterium]